MALFTSIGTALGLTGLAATAAGVATVGAIGAGGFALASMMGGDKKSDTGQIQMPATPAAPKQADASALAKQQAMDRQRAAGRSESVKTNPLGIKDEADVVRKKLLGS